MGVSFHVIQNSRPPFFFCFVNHLLAYELNIQALEAMPAMFIQRTILVRLFCIKTNIMIMRGGIIC